MTGYLRGGSPMNLVCSCAAEVVMCLVLVGVHRHHTVWIVTRGSS